MVHLPHTTFGQPEFRNSQLVVRDWGLPTPLHPPLQQTSVGQAQVLMGAAALLCEFLRALHVLMY